MPITRDRKFWRTLLPRLGLAGALVATLSCRDPVSVCTLELRTSLWPSSALMNVGMLLEPEVRVASCGGKLQRTTDVVLFSYDTTVVRVTPDLKGIIAISPGTAVVDVSLATHGLVDMIAVRVTPAP